MTEQTAPQSDVSIPAQPATVQPRRRRTRLWVAIGGGAALVLAAGTATAAVALSASEPSGPNTRQLVKACRASVKATLAAPATAQWPGGEVVEEAPGSGDDVWRVDGGVDAQNHYGALLRSHWTCFGAWRNGRWEIREAALN